MGGKRCLIAISLWKIPSQSGLYFRKMIQIAVWRAGSRERRLEVGRPVGEAVEYSKTGVRQTAAAAAKSLQSCLTLCDPIDGSPPGSAIPEILQARTLEWVSMAFSNAGK